MLFLKMVLGLSAFIFMFLFVNIAFSTPPALSSQINVKTMSVIKLNTYSKTYNSDYAPSGGSWGAGGSYGGK